eukprot:520503_1
MDNAIISYYNTLQHNPDMLFEQCANFMQDISNDETVYNIGVKFWYWKPRNEDERKCYVTSKCANLKGEILNELTAIQWNQLQTECKILLKTDKIIQITSNGKKK